MVPCNIIYLPVFVNFAVKNFDRKCIFIHGVNDIHSQIVTTNQKGWI